MRDQSTEFVQAEVVVNRGQRQRKQSASTAEKNIPQKSAHELERTANSWILSGFEDSSKALEWIGRLLSILNRRVIKSTGVSLDSAGHGSRLSL